MTKRSTQILPILVIPSILVVVVFCSRRTCGASKDGILNIIFNGRSIGSGIEIHGTAYVPVRAVAESFGAKVSYSETARSVSIDANGAGRSNVSVSSVPNSTNPADVETETNPKDGAEVVYVAAGPFLMGDDDNIIVDTSFQVLYRNNPRHTVTLSAYFIYKNLVTVAMYRKFCIATGREMPSPPSWGWKSDNPMVNVSWDDANAYCGWAGARLPTDAEWEKAARGTDGRKYPWGDDFDESRLWCSSTKYGDTRETHSVGGFPSGASPYGALDMAGNVWQWCADWYDPDYWANRRRANTDPVNDVWSGFRVVRGGSWSGFGSVYRSAYRKRVDSTFQDDEIGFRAVVAAGPT